MAGPTIQWHSAQRLARTTWPNTKLNESRRTETNRNKPKRTETDRQIVDEQSDKRRRQWSEIAHFSLVVPGRARLGRFHFVYTLSTRRSRPARATRVHMYYPNIHVLILVHMYVYTHIIYVYIYTHI